MRLLRSKALGMLAARVALMICLAAALSACSGSRVPPGWKAEGLEPIGYNDLNGLNESFKLAIKQVNNRWYLYMGHFAHRGWSIVDVTDPKDPKYVKFIPGPENTSTFQVDLHDNIMITALSRSSASWGADADKPYSEGMLIWDISDPVNPKQLAHWKGGSTGTHRNGYPGGKYANLAANVPGFRGQILLFLDISDPSNPKEAGRWWLPGQKEGEEPARTDYSFHGPAFISEDGKTAYVAHSDRTAILDISDISQPKVIGQLVTSPPFRPGGTGSHDVLVIPGKDLLFTHSEATSGDRPESPPCSQPLFNAAMLDIKDPTKPRMISQFPVPVPPKDEPYTDFCDKGGRFGPHNTNLEYHLPDVQKQGDLVYLTYFNAGLRVFDIKDPRQPREVAWFIPPTPTKRGTPIPYPPLVTQTEDVLVDTRGNIYISDKQWGIFVLRYTGEKMSSADSKDGAEMAKNTAN